MTQTDWRELCSRMADELDHYRQLLADDRREVHRVALEARAALAQPEPVGATPQCVADGCLDEAARQEAGSPLQQLLLEAGWLLSWGRPTPQPIPVSERLPGPEGPTDEQRFTAFAQWLAREMPPNTVIGDPLWWAPRIARAVLRHMGRPTPQPIPVSERRPGSETPAGGEVPELVNLMWTQIHADAAEGGIYAGAIEQLLTRVQSLEATQHAHITESVSDETLRILKGSKSPTLRSAHWLREEVGPHG